MRMKKTLRDFLLMFVLASALIAPNFISFEKKEVKSKRDARLPEVRRNQHLILHPEYLKGTISLGYTLLTDVDHNGDIMQDLHQVMAHIKFILKKVLDLHNLCLAG